MQKTFETIKGKVAAGQRISDAEALSLFESQDLLAIGELAAGANRRKNGDKVYFNVNRHINYTNLCVNRCKFCAFSKEAEEPGVYTLALEQIAEKAREAAVAGATEIHTVGGLHPDLPFAFYLQMLETIKQVDAGLHIKGFTAVEIDYFSQLSGLSIEEVIDALKRAGLGSLPGGGAEILGQKVRAQICPEKISGARWLEVTEKVHAAGLRSNATMLFGHLEGYADRVEHLTGGVPGWEWPELSPLVEDVDAVLINFISGYEMTLGTTLQLRREFAGPIHADLHSLFLGSDDDGTRRPSELEEYEAWASCFDVVQMNEDEASLAMSMDDGDHSAIDRRIDCAIDAALGSGARLVVVTRGAAGVVWRAAKGVPYDPAAWSGFSPPEGEGRGASRSVTIRPRPGGDPTGCGDVWGATMFSRLLAGDGPEVSIDMANRLAARNTEHRGAEGLYDILRSEVRL